MALIELDISAERTDGRSNEAAFTVTARNIGPKTLALLALTPRSPAGSTIIPLRDVSREVAKEKHARICDELRLLLRAFAN